MRFPETNFSLFVYGTLKRGFANHERFCRNLRRIEEATVRGRLYDLPFGFPALVVAPDIIRAVGSASPVEDAGMQRHLNEQPPALPTGEARVFGELLTFDDPQDRLPKLDHLEGFRPEEPSLYRRVLVPVETATHGVLAWAYAIEQPSGRHLVSGNWPA